MCANMKVQTPVGSEDGNVGEFFSAHIEVGLLKKRELDKKEIELWAIVSFDEEVIFPLSYFFS